MSDKDFHFYIPSYQQFRSAQYVGQDIIPGWRVTGINPGLTFLKLGLGYTMSIDLDSTSDLYKVEVSGNSPNLKAEAYDVLAKLFCMDPKYLKDTQPYCEFTYRVDMLFNLSRDENTEQHYRVGTIQEVLDNSITKEIADLYHFDRFTRRHRELLVMFKTGRHAVVGSIVGDCPGFEDIEEFKRLESST